MISLAGYDYGWQVCLQRTANYGKGGAPYALQRDVVWLQNSLRIGTGIEESSVKPHGENLCGSASHLCKVKYKQFFSEGGAFRLPLHCKYSKPDTEAPMNLRMRCTKP